MHVSSPPSNPYEKNKSRSRASLNGKKFSNRMKSLAPELTQLQESYQPASRQINDRKRNTISAQQSRRRKKVYVQLLQESITNMQQQLYDTNEELDMARTHIFNALMHTSQYDTANPSVQSHILKKLKHLVQETNEPRNRDEEINISLDSCLFRTGAAGSERKAILDILYKAFINRNLPNIYRYIIWSATHQAHLFGSELHRSQDELWRSDIYEIGEEIISKRGHLLQQKGANIAKKSKEIIRCSKKILKMKREIELYGQTYDNLLREFRKIMTPVQFANLFLFVERSIHKRELRFDEPTDSFKQVEQEQLQNR